ncbi:MAG: WD40 repeat domain-containing protein [Acidimicrobiales bacterium]
MSGYAAKVQHLAWDSTSRFLAVGNMLEVTVWDFSGKGPAGTAPKDLSGIDKPISALAYQHQGSLLAAGSVDGRLSLWDPSRGERSLFQAYATSEVSTLSWSPDDTRLLATTAAGDAVINRVDTR